MSAFLDNVKAPIKQPTNVGLVPRSDSIHTQYTNLPFTNSLFHIVLNNFLQILLVF